MDDLATGLLHQMVSETVWPPYQFRVVNLRFDNDLLPGVQDSLDTNGTIFSLSVLHKQVNFEEPEHFKEYNNEEVAGTFMLICLYF